MSRRISAVLIIGLGFILEIGCGGQSQPSLPLSNAASHQALPFDRTSENNGVSPTQSFAAVTIPAGTAIIVKLSAPLSSADSHIGEDFSAVLEEPVMLQDQVLIARGAVFTGKVIAAQPSGTNEPGYLRLTLSDVIFDHKSLELRSSSIFAKGFSRSHREKADPAGAGDAVPSEVKFSTARRLTFHLIDELPLHD